jgi:choline kinase
MSGEFLQVNGDNVFRSDVVERLLSAPPVPVGVAVNIKESYDADDMKVILRDEVVRDIGKTLDMTKVGAEAVGFYLFRGKGVAGYIDVLDRFMRDGRGLKNWFPSAVAALAQEMEVRTISIAGLKWGEVDFPEDLDQARQLVASWG